MENFTGFYYYCYHPQPLPCPLTHYYSVPPSTEAVLFLLQLKTSLSYGPFKEYCPALLLSPSSMAFPSSLHHFISIDV